MLSFAIELVSQAICELIGCYDVLMRDNSVELNQRCFWRSVHLYLPLIVCHYESDCPITYFTFFATTTVPFILSSDWPLNDYLIDC